MTMEPITLPSIVGWNGRLPVWGHPRLFAFSPNTDPNDVLLAVAWAHPEPGLSPCGPRCPMQGDGYCPDCHWVAQTAKDELIRRWASR